MARAKIATTIRRTVGASVSTDRNTCTCTSTGVKNNSNYDDDGRLAQPQHCLLFCKAAAFRRTRRNEGDLGRPPAVDDKQCPSDNNVNSSEAVAAFGDATSTTTTLPLWPRLNRLLSTETMTAILGTFRRAPTHNVVFTVTTTTIWNNHQPKRSLPRRR